MLKKEIIIAGLKVNYLVSQDFQAEHALVFLPGWQSPADLFCSVMADTSNLIALNLPGWGGSERPEASWGLAEYAGFLQEFLGKLNINHPILIGHSIGAAVAVEYLDKLASAKKLIIIGGAIIREKSFKTNVFWVGAKIFRFFLPFVGRDWRRRLSAGLINSDYAQAGGLSDIYQRLIKEDGQEAFRRLHLPTALIWGENDQDTPFSQALRLKAMQSTASLDSIPFAGHYCFLDQPSLFKEAINKYL
jgi:pimeloyl-ACP methyl ester carboxylesterase